jgi:HrpA-like RNA helicase
MLTNKSPLSAPSSAREKAKAQHVQFLSDNASVNILKKLYPLSYPDHSASSVEVPSSTCEAVYSDVDAEVDCCSDFIAVVQAYDIWDYISTTRGSKEAANFCKQYFLSASALGNIKSTRDHYRRHLISAGFINCGSKNSTKDVEADTTNEGVVEPIEDEDRECDATWEEPLEAEGTEKVATGSGRSATITDPALRSREARLREWSLVRCALCAGISLFILLSV